MILIILLFILAVSRGTRATVIFASNVGERVDG